MKTYVDTTVIIPTKGKRLNLLINAIDKIYNNIYLPKKIIIVIDNNISAYKNLKLLFKTYNNIIIKHNSDKKGVSATRNYGVKFVNTKYISFLDDDDYWDKNYLKEVFSENNFDISLAGFKKKKESSFVNEKLPPLELKSNYFLVKNPGIRGSNITITKELFKKIGGFNENLLSFNDMDFGLKLCKQKYIKYKSVQKHLVIFNSHNNERISTAGSIENIQGLIEFLIIHGNKMSYEDEAKFRKRAIKIWGIDPHSLKYLEKRFERIKDNKENFNLQFTNLLHASETLLFEEIYKCNNQKYQIQNFIDKLCHQYEEYNKNREFSIKIAITTTNSKNAVRDLITTAIAELEKSKFNYKSPKPIIEFLVVENSTETEIINSNKEFCNNFKNNKVKINYICWEEKTNTNEIQKPFQIAKSRAFLINKINSLNWKASKKHPIWILDDDFEFTTTIPATNYKTENIRLGSIFHRLESIAKENELDAIVGGNSGSPPVPELSTIRLQLEDLKEIFQTNSQQKSWKNVLIMIRQNPDYYYDLSRFDIDYFSVAQKNPISKNKLEFTDDFFNKLLTGVPATRYLFANFNSNNEYNSAWNLCDNIAVSGGNTIYLNSDLLNLKMYWGIEYKNIKSRRADAIWFLLKKQKGYKIQKINFPLTHARTRRINKECNINTQIDRSLKDILGVALWETVFEISYSKLINIDKKILHQRIEKRLEKFENNLTKVEQLLKEIAMLFPEATQLVSFNTLLNISKNRIQIDYKQINLVDYGS